MINVCVCVRGGGCSRLESFCDEEVLVSYGMITISHTNTNTSGSLSFSFILNQLTERQEAGGRSPELGEEPDG